MTGLNTALGLLKHGDPQNALREAMQVYGREPHSAELLTLIAELHGMLQDSAAAVPYFERVAALTPGDAAAHRRLAHAQFNAGFDSASIASYRRSLELEPGSVRAHNNLGRVLERIGDSRGAAKCYRMALALDDTYAIAHNNLGNILAASGQRSEALERYQRAVVLRPDFAQAWHNCARTLLAMKRAAEALPCSDKATALGPAFAEAWFVRGEALNELERCEEALECCDKAIALRHDYGEALCARANLRRGMSDHRGAVAGFREALRVNPSCETARIGAAVAEIPALPWTVAEAAAAREAFAAALDELDAQLKLNPCGDAAALVGALQPFFLAYQEHDNRRLLEHHGRLCAKLMGAWQQREALVPTARARATRSKPRVAFVSAQIADHSVYHAITRGWLNRLDRGRFHVEVFHLGSKTDEHTQAAQNVAGHFEQGQRSLRQWSEAILARHADVLIYPEVGMDQTTLQLAGMRLAPAQVVTWGHPVTSGLPTLDYYLSAAAFEPAHSAQHYTERLHCLPNLGVYYEPPSRPSGAAQPAARNGAAGPVLVCAGTPFKYLPEHDAVLVEIARRLGRCQFHFFKYRDGALSRRLLNRLHSAFSSARLDGAAFLVLRPWAAPGEFHDILASADLFLDTIGFSGFNTVMQALECGLPVITRRGRFLRGRLGSGILERLSLPELIADSSCSYVETAVSLAQNPAARTCVRDRLRMNLPTLYRDQSAIDDLESFLLSIV
jgi:predicted O-linked N-acetylglucosamine transferase (SPINDLY family)